MTAGGAPFPLPEAVAWRGNAVTGTLELLDQTELPGREIRLARRHAGEIVEDIRRLAVRGAPAIGVAAAYALVLAARDAGEGEPGPARFRDRLRAEARRLPAARPTAVNLAFAVQGV
ncbi:MAG: S-methyl-5-thioribose-1-phosphate isomerase, partial [Planctomycetota bacterium]